MSRGSSRNGLTLPVGERNHRQGRLINVRLIHQEFAEVTGTSRATVTQLLQMFKQKRLIQRFRRHIILSGEQQCLESSIVKFTQCWE